MRERLPAAFDFPSLPREGVGGEVTCGFSSSSLPGRGLGERLPAVFSNSLPS